MWLAMGAGLVPLPLLDYAVLMGIQLRMLRQLSRNYHVPFSHNGSKAMISALLGLVIPASLTNTVTSALKLVPLTGPLVGGISLAAFGSATTYAIGKIFLQHFESGGTLLSLDPATVREHFRREFERGQALARQMRSTAVVPPAPVVVTPAETPGPVVVTPPEPPAPVMVVTPPEPPDPIVL
jgi:uncharacterized protein (DUF697 family)